MAAEAGRATGVVTSVVGDPPSAVSGNAWLCSAAAAVPSTRRRLVSWGSHAAREATPRHLARARTKRAEVPVSSTRPRRPAQRPGARRQSRPSRSTLRRWRLRRRTSRFLAGRQSASSRAYCCCCGASPGSTGLALNSWQAPRSTPSMWRTGWPVLPALLGARTKRLREAADEALLLLRRARQRRHRPEPPRRVLGREVAQEGRMWQREASPQRSADASKQAKQGGKWSLAGPATCCGVQHGISLNVLAVQITAMPNQSWARA